MGEPQTYHGSCHCGAVKYDAKLDLSKPAMTCNCSICQRTGSVLSFIPAGDFRLESGEEALTDYQFGKKHIHHVFCKTCGVRSFARGTLADGTPMVAVNLRCLEDIELEKVQTRQFNGRAR
jgi:hypothetical protein